MAVMPLLLMAQGWPANYGGVMLQSFEWDGYDATKWSALTANSDELSQCFDLIWVPQSGFIPGDPASTPARSMGYNDVYWLKQDSYFGTETELRNMISTFKSKGTGIIADVVVNHKNGASNWTDFPNESKNGYTLTWNPLENICNTDEYNRSDQVKYGYATGEADTGDDFDGCRDLDHTNSKVQQNIITYQKFLLNDLGYAGIRLDMVKGYGGEYTKIYNQATNPTFSVGEYWDGDYNAVMNWVNATGKTSAAFDFPLKYIINEAVGNGNYGALSNKGIAGDPNNSRYSVTFADNHDTGQDGNGSRLTKDWSAANAVILAMPGTPCIWIKHYNVDKTSIKAMIFARRAAGVHNQSSIVEQQESNGGYIIRTRGTNGDVYVQLGGATNNGTPSGMKQVAQGDNYKFFCTSSLDITTPHKPGSITPTPTPTPDPTPSNVTVYFKNTQGWSSVNCYAYIDDSNNGEWPGAAMTYDADITVNGSKGWWKYTLPTGLENSNVIFNGDGNQYPGAMESGLAVGGSSMACDGTEWSAATVGGGDDPTPQPGGKTTIYVKSATAPYLYVWDGAGGEPNGAWPGAQMTQKDGDYWVASFDQAPLNAIFHNNQGGDSNQTGNIEGLSGDNYFTYDGTSGYTTESAPVPDPTPQPGGKTTVYVKASSAPHLYAWYMDGETAVELNGAWPGTQLTQQSDGYWLASFDAAPINIIFNDGVGGTVGVNQTENIEDISGDNYFTYDGAGSYTTESAPVPDPTPQPSGKTTIYVKSDVAPHLYVWAYGEPDLNGAWPGNQMTQKEGDYWVASFDKAPVSIIFNDGTAEGGVVGVNQTENIEDISGDNYFTYDGGGNYTQEGSTSIDSVPTVEFKTNNIYTIDGRRIRQNATSLQDLKPGVYIVGGKKIVKY